MPEAVIDIGSNSVRLLVDRGFSVQKKEVVTTLLAQGSSLSRTLTEAAMSRTFEAVEQLYRTAGQNGAARIRIFATEAVRSAVNGAAFATRISDALKTPVHILSGAEEARLGFVGAAGLSGSACVLDIGGASVELIAGKNGRIDYSKSLPLGVQRLREAAGDDRAALQRLIDGRIGAFGEIHATTLTGIGGTATSLASMFLRQTVYDPAAVHGTALTEAALTSLTDEIFACPNICAAFPTVDEKRAGVIRHGALLTLAILRHTHAAALSISERDNMEGYLHIYR